LKAAPTEDFCLEKIRPLIARVRESLKNEPADQKSGDRRGEHENDDGEPLTLSSDARDDPAPPETNDAKPGFSPSRDPPKSSHGTHENHEQSPEL
jgi:hypothetical protein